MSMESERRILLEGDAPGTLAVSVDGAIAGSLDLVPAYKPFWVDALGLASSSVPWTIDIELESEWRGRRIGRAAIARASQLAFTLGATDVVVDVRAENVASVRCFEGAGYERSRFEENHDEGDGDVGPFWFLRLRRPRGMAGQPNAAPDDPT